MSDPTRLCEGDSFEAGLLSTARHERPGTHVDARVRGALGLATVVGATASAATTAAASTVAAAAATTPSVGVGTAGTVGLLAGAKWVGVALVSAAVIGPVVWQATAPIPHPSVVSASVPARALEAPTPADRRAIAPPSPILASPASPASTTSEQAPVALRRAASPTVPVGSLPSTTSPATPGLLDEVTPLDAARAALEAGDTGLALERINRHDLDFPHGQLAPEALALRTEVYARRGDAVRVRALGGEFVARYPTHPQVGRVKGFLASARPDAP